MTSPFYPSYFPFPRLEYSLCGLPLGIWPFNYAYGDRVNCPYHISQPNGTVINLNFTVWNLFYRDCLEIRDGYDGDSALLGKFCRGGYPDYENKEAPPPIQSTQNHVWMRYIFVVECTLFGLFTHFLIWISVGHQITIAATEVGGIAKRAVPVDFKSSILRRRKLLIHSLDTWFMLITRICWYD